MQKRVYRGTKEVPAWIRYGGAAILAVIMLCTSVIFKSYIEHTAYIFAFIAVTLSAAYGGFGPALLAVFISVLGIDYFLIPPGHVFHFAERDLLGAGLFSFVSLVIARLASKQHQARRDLLLLMDSNPGGITFIDSDLCVRFLNKTAAARLGISPLAAYRRPIEQLVEADIFMRMKPHIDKALAGEATIFEIEDHGGGKEAKQTLVSCIPSISSKGQVLGFYIFWVDITERKRMEENLRRNEERLSRVNGDQEKEIILRVDQLRKKDEELYQIRKLEAIGQLAGGIAHDFNNLITGILGISQDLQDSFEENDPRKEDTQQIISASHRTANLTRQLLAFGRRQMSTGEIIDMNETIKDVAKMLERLMPEDIRLDIRLGTLGTIKLDSGQLQQVLINLAVNARDAMPDGGRLSIGTGLVKKTDGDPHGRIPTVPGDYAVLEVTDTGSGMSQETLSHIFEPFFTTKSEKGGTGLGLATVHGIVKQNNGDIHVYSEPGVGTTFKIYFPTVERTVAIPKEAPKPKKAKGGETVLVVEDEDIVRHVVAKKLRTDGYMVLEARNGREALDLAQKPGSPIDLVVTDVVMPEMNGPEVVTRIRLSRPGIAVLYISGYPEDVIAHRGILQPGIDFLEKPLVADQITIKVREVLDKSHVFHLVDVSN
jgi:two-component system, cell cycle sensor histidine kinase and response regulator CckA